jgi:prevent-host-death family protein
MCYILTHMNDRVGVRELRQNLSKYLDRVKDGEALVVTERGRQVARLIPAGAMAEPYVDLAERFGATVPVQRFESIAAPTAVLEPCPRSTSTRVRSAACYSASPTPQPCCAISRNSSNTSRAG